MTVSQESSTFEGVTGLLIQHKARSILQNTYKWLMSEIAYSHQSGKCPTVELTSTLFALIKIFRSLIGGQEHMDIRDVDEIQVVDHVDLPQVVHHIEQPHNLCFPSR